jgi:hypothetical protein
MRKILPLAALLLCLLGGRVAWAVNCPSFPFTLLPGQIASATQVMADLNNLLTCANTILGTFSGPASSVDGNLVAFNGTTGQLGKDSGVKFGVWTAYTPTITCLTGAATPSVYNLIGEYIQIGKTVLFTINIAVTTNGTCGGNWSITLPIVGASVISFVVTGRDGFSGAVGGCGISQASPSFMLCDNAGGGYPGYDNMAWAASGSYQLP